MEDMTSSPSCTSLSARVPTVTVGTLVGTEDDGADVGSTEGLNVFRLPFLLVGKDVGCPLGCPVGCPLGWVGENDGCDDGMLVGNAPNKQLPGSLGDPGDNHL